VDKAGLYVLAPDATPVVTAFAPMRVLCDSESDEEGQDIARQFGLKLIVETWVLIKTETAVDYTADAEEDEKLWRCVGCDTEEESVSCPVCEECGEPMKEDKS
jgi:hypothetical protein